MGGCLGALLTGRLGYLRMRSDAQEAEMELDERGVQLDREEQRLMREVAIREEQLGTLERQMHRCKLLPLRERRAPCRADLVHFRRIDCDTASAQRQLEILNRHLKSVASQRAILAHYRDRLLTTDETKIVNFLHEMEDCLAKYKAGAPALAATDREMFDAAQKVDAIAAAEEQGAQAMTEQGAGAQALGGALGRLGSVNQGAEKSDAEIEALMRAEWGRLTSSSVASVALEATAALAPTASPLPHRLLPPPQLPALLQ